MKPKLDGIRETALYVDDLKRARKFYEDLFELEAMNSDHRFCAYNISGEQVLLLFKRGSSTSPIRTPLGTIPPHDGHGQLHVGFGVDAESLPSWEKRLEERGIGIESRVVWETGGTSIYFRDPDGNLLELLTRGNWVIY